MPASPQPDTPRASSAVGGRRALVVDDEPTIRRALRRFLERQGWEVDEAEDGAGGLAVLTAAGAPAYDVIVSDLIMPGMSGEAFYDAVAAARPALAGRVIVTTGDAFSPAASRFLRRTGCVVLQKPFELAELRAAMERVAGAT